MTAVGQRTEGGMSIGSVLDRLRPDFPDITISKIRFLEAEGLISPERTPSGYRRFSLSDCERLRFVLTAQRDQYLPLKVIKEQLEAIDSGVAVVGSTESAPRRPRALAIAPGEVSPEEFRANREVRISRTDLIARSGADEAFLAELLRSGLIVPGVAGFFDEDAVTLARAAKAMSEFGLEVRHLRAFKLAADREAGLVAQIAGPVAKGRDAGARDRAEEMVRELAALSLTLHTCLVKAAVRGALDR
ncbi:MULTISPECIES: transcriptional regulator FtsR [Rhodococcus]|uniref:MerR family regulatory protein n=1 Tax=Rhodococcus maanshanensis TaxID=183556 RepID=A0A1H7M4F5_9NOCA|nr:MULTISPECIES: MerR family transcriptional regulator [Rhodococcus]SEL05989.1 MerR family regulatory protein [Rhodococcus maanshanensis]